MKRRKQGRKKKTYFCEMWQVVMMLIRSKIYNEGDDILHIV